MAAALRPEFLKDVSAPVMQTGSSSHTAVPWRLGGLAGNPLGEPTVRLWMFLNRGGPCAGTFGLVAEDRAIVPGVFGLCPGDECMRTLLAGASAKDNRLSAMCVETPRANGSALGSAVGFWDMGAGFDVLMGWPGDGVPEEATVRRLELDQLTGCRGFSRAVGKD